MIATGVNADGYREILGLPVSTSESHAGWLALFRDMTARGLTGVQLVTSDAHDGLEQAIAATLPRAAWQRCRTHFSANLQQQTTKNAWGRVKALMQSVFDQPDAQAVRGQFDKVVETPGEINAAKPRTAPRLKMFEPTAFPNEDPHFRVGPRSHEIADHENAHNSSNPT